LKRLRNDDVSDALYDKARTLVIMEGYATVALIQRHLLLGYNGGLRIVARLEADGVVSAPDHTGRRRLLRRIDPEQQSDISKQLKGGTDEPESAKGGA